jgi:uncharacterized delta-60 repeat protein
LAPPIVVMGCADLIGIGELPGAPDAASDARADVTGTPDASSHDGARPDASKSGGDAGEGGVDAGAMTLTVAPTGVHLVRGASASVTVNVARKSGPAAKVTITATGLPAGVTAGALTIPASSPMGTLTLTASASGATLGPASVSVQGGGSSAPLELVVADPTGTYDTTFGSGGGIVTYIPSGGTTNATANAVAILDDGSLVVGGSPGGSGTGWSVVHVLSNGMVDTKFALPPLPTTGQVQAINRGPVKGPLAGTVLVSGPSAYCDLESGVNEATVFILAADGSAYSAFGGGGYWCADDMSYTQGTTAVGAGAATTGEVYIGINSFKSGAAPFITHLTDTAAADPRWSNAGLSASVSLVGLVVDPSDNVIVTGSYGSNQLFAQRFTATSTGAHDPTFAGGTGVIGPASAFLYGQASALDPDAGVYVGGAGTLTGETPVLGHVTGGGAIDLGGDAGWVADNFYVEQNLGYVGLAVQSDGRVLGIGNGGDMVGALPYIARTTSDGKLDKSFNADAGANAGFYVVQSKTSLSYDAVAVAPLPDGRIVIVGAEAGSGMFLLRMWP